jgi:hypothetical protein
MTTSTSERRTFYLAMACLSALVAVVGFSRRYLLPLAAGTMDAPAIVHWHGLIMFAWVMFFIVQTSLVARGRTARHRSLGLAGIALGTLLVYTAIQLALLLLARELKDGGPPFLREFVATLLGWALLAGGLFGFAIAAVKKPEVHKRLMLLANFVILAPAFARIIQLVDHDLTRLLRNDLANLPVDILVLVGMAYDWRTRGKPHAAYVAGGAAILLVQIATILVRTTPAWTCATTWLAGLVG